MFTKESMRAAMIAAIDNEENRFRNGDVNWDFVDADVYMEVFGEVELDDRDNETFYKWFDELAFEYKNRLTEIQLITRMHMMQATHMVH